MKEDNHTTLRLGLIGAGAMGQKHAALIKNIPGARLVAICDVNPDVCKVIRGAGSTQNHWRGWAAYPGGCLGNTGFRQERRAGGI